MTRFIFSLGTLFILGASTFSENSRRSAVLPASTAIASSQGAVKAVTSIQAPSALTAGTLNTAKEIRLAIARGERISDRRVTFINGHVAKLGPAHLCDDWEAFLRTKVFPRLGPTGASKTDRVGTVVLTDQYGLKRPLKNVSPYINFVGEHPVAFHGGNSYGFYVTDEFEGDVVLAWDPILGRGKTHWHSNFGAGMENVFITARDGVDGVHFVGAQQASRIRNVFIRGFGSAVGLKLAGDTFSVSDVFIDSSVGKTRIAERSTGILQEDESLVSVIFSNVTIHNCEVGVSLRWAESVVFDLLETEHVRTNIVIKQQATNVSFRNCNFRHISRALLDLEVVQHPGAFKLTIDAVARGKAIAILPDRSEKPLTNWALIPKRSRVPGLVEVDSRELLKPD